MVLAVTVLAAALLVLGAPSGAPPAEAATRRVALWGDSIANDADARLEARVTGQGFSYYGRTIDSSTVRDHFADVSSRMSGSAAPHLAIFELGTGDARDGRSSADMRSDIRSMLSRARGADCVRWLNVKAHGVNGIYAGVVAYAGRFNQALADVRASGDFPNFRVVDFNLWAYFNPGAFSADGLHFNSAGADLFARWVANDVADTCTFPPPPTTTTTTRPTTTTTRPTTTTTRPTTTTTRPTTTTTTTTTTVPSGGWSTTATADPQAHVGGLVSYEVAVRNTGTATLRDVTVTSTHVAVESAGSEGGEVPCGRTVASIAVGATHRFSCAVNAPAAAEGRRLQAVFRAQPAGMVGRLSNAAYTQVLAGQYCSGRLGSVYLADGDRPTAGGDVVIGTGGRDNIALSHGADVACLFDGDDIVYAGPGADDVRGGDGADTLNGDDGADTLNGGRGTDVCDGGAGTDTHGGGCETRRSIP